MDQQSMVEGLGRLMRPMMESGGMMKRERGGELEHFDLQSVDELMHGAYVQGAQRGYHDARDEAEAQLERVRETIVKDALTHVLTWLVPLYSELEEALLARVDVEPDPERPADEWADDRHDRLQAVVNEFRDALPMLAHVAGQTALVPDRFEGQVELWREVHPSDPEPVRDVKAVPAAALTNAQLAAVLDNDTDAFEHAGRVIVPEALETLRARAAAEQDDDDYEPKASRILAERGVDPDKDPDERA